MIKKNEVVTIGPSDKKYSLVIKEQQGDIIKVDFIFEEQHYFGRVMTISSNGNLVVKVKGIFGVDDENDLT